MEREINLLPRALQHARNRRLYAARFGRLFRRFGVALVLIILAQFGAWLFYVSLLREVSNQLAVVMPGSEATGQIAATNQLLGSFQRQVTQQVVWSELVSDILTQTAAVTVTSIRTVDSGRIIEIRGETASRAAVVALQEALAALPWVERVEAPLQNFTVGPNAQFSLRVQRNESL
ncbi:MAG TPA: hypothetical protein VJC05_04150 [Candidatus Andersenbacteria bacterium]|nr:hypothetical protein [Candidatus Andersenbacteria bacterium]